MCEGREYVGQASEKGNSEMLAGIREGKRPLGRGRGVLSGKCEIQSRY